MEIEIDKVALKETLAELIKIELEQKEIIEEEIELVCRKIALAEAREKFKPLFKKKIYDK